MDFAVLYVDREDVAEQAQLSIHRCRRNIFSPVSLVFFNLVYSDVLQVAGESVQ